MNMFVYLNAQGACPLLDTENQTLQDQEHYISSEN